MTKKIIPLFIAVAGLLGSGVAALQAAPEASASKMQDRSAYVGITEPSQSLKLGFGIRGVVDKVEVKRNDRVKAGQPVMSLLDIEEVATLKMYQLRADTSLDIARAQEAYNVKKIDYEKKKKLYENPESRGSASEFEVKSAEAEMNIARIEIDKAKHEGATAQAQADAQQARIDLMHKTSPIDGEVRDIIVKPGEQVDETKPVVEIVKLDPLYVEVKLLNTNLVQKLKLGDKVQVKYGDEERWRDAVVESIDPQADARTGTHPFRLSLPNPEGRTAGLRVDIQLPSNVASAE